MTKTNLENIAKNRKIINHIQKVSEYMTGPYSSSLYFEGKISSWRKLDSEEKKSKIEKKAKKLIRNEWKRWVPVLGVSKYFKDFITADGEILTNLYSSDYFIMNTLYHTATTLAISGIFGLLHF